MPNKNSYTVTGTNSQCDVDVNSKEMDYNPYQNEISYGNLALPTTQIVLREPNTSVTKGSVFTFA